MAALPVLTLHEVVPWLKAQGCTGLCADSRQLRQCDAFLAWPGAKADPREQVQAAVLAGHSCVVEASGADAFELPAQGVVAVIGLKELASQIAAQFVGRPSEYLHVVAVTGTNGKTSTAWWLSQAFAKTVYQKAEQQSEQIRGQPGKNTKKQLISSLMIGTLGRGQPPKVQAGTLTTPDAISLQNWLAEALAAGASSVVMEASSIGIAQHRMDALSLHTAIFTNFTQDHLDYHGSMANYWAAKRKLFDWPGLKAAVVNVDDAAGHLLSCELRSREAISLWTISTKGEASLVATQVRYNNQGMSFEVRSAQGETAQVRARCVGQFNVLNLLGVVAAICATGKSLAQACAAASDLLPVPGRLEPIGVATNHLPLVLVDYAHTPDALVQCLTTLRELATLRQGQLICVFGCGGDRDRSKRAPMAQAVESHADVVWLTQDNPRFEAAAQITADVMAGFRLPAKHRVEPNRAHAIADAIANASAKDVLVIAGKGHEDYQDICGVKLPFSDAEHALRALQAMEPVNP